METVPQDVRIKSLLYNWSALTNDTQTRDGRLRWSSKHRLINRLKVKACDRLLVRRHNRSISFKLYTDWSVFQRWSPPLTTAEREKSSSSSASPLWQNFPSATLPLISCSDQYVQLCTSLYRDFDLLMRLQTHSEVTVNQKCSDSRELRSKEIVAHRFYFFNLAVWCRSKGWFRRTCSLQPGKYLVFPGPTGPTWGPRWSEKEE